MTDQETPIADVLGRAHASLLGDLRELEEAGRAAPAHGLQALRGRLAAVRRHLAEHFFFEEEHGYMDPVRRHEPRLGRVIDELGKEHGQLMGSLDRLLAESATATNIDDLFRASIFHWIDEVRRHEARENRLVQEAFNLDMGSEG
jgi:hypothetical protein